MNSFFTFYKQQEGILKDFTYDIALRRLSVQKNDSWRGITPSTYNLDYNPEPPIFAAKFANCSNYKHILAIANEDGKIALQNTNLKNTDYVEKALDGQQCHYNAVFDLEWAPNSMAFVSASGDHTARLWVVTQSEIISCREFTGHTRSVKTAAFRKTDASVFATGGRDGAILIWDIRVPFSAQQRADNCIYRSHVGGPGTPVSQRKRTTRTPKQCPKATSSSITGLVFQDENTLVSCGAGDGVIKIWDLRRNYSSFKREPLPKYSLPYAGTSTFKGFTNLLYDDLTSRLYANCMDNTIYCYNLSSSMMTIKPIERYVGLRNSTFYIKSCLSPDGNYLLSGSSDEKAYIWNLKNPQPLVTLNGHSVEVTCVAWSGSNETSIVTCSDDACHKIWRIGPEKIPLDEIGDYKGNAEYCKEYQMIFSSVNNKLLMRKRLESLDRTPRSLKRIVEENEKTPSSVEKVSTKRSFNEMNNEEYTDDNNGSDKKRLHLETRARRLFSPSTSATTAVASTSSGISGRKSHERDFNSTSVLDEPAHKQLKLSPVLNHQNDSNQENSTEHHTQASSSSTMTATISNNTITTVSPLCERISFNLQQSPIASTSQTNLSASQIFSSPTSNLPNYVIDGNAPHLGIMSPKRVHKDKIDWLTKIRKQKLMSNRTTSITEKLLGTNVMTATMPIATTTGDTTSYDKDNINNSRLLHSESNNFLSSPRLQSLRTSECSPNNNNNDQNTPKRRISHSSDRLNNNSATIHKTPTTNRRNSETTILKFFSTITTQQPRNHRDEQINNNNGNNLHTTMNATSVVAGVNACTNQT